VNVFWVSFLYPTLQASISGPGNVAPAPVSATDAKADGDARTATASAMPRTLIDLESFIFPLVRTK
jgi:hypothetical protein